MATDRRVLILCTGNSCRSALAEALWRHHWGDRWEVRSAGTAPTGNVHPLVPEVLAERDIDPSGLVSEPLDRFDHEAFDLIITVCDQARESCPSPQNGTRILHWPFPDPAEYAEGATTREALKVFRTARDAIEDRILRYRTAIDRVAEGAQWLRQVHGQLAVSPSSQRSEAFLGLVDDIEKTVTADRSVWEELPALIAARYEPFGWEWNGFYQLRGTAPNRQLVLAAAAGPPVCASIDEQEGGVGASGMCFDAIHVGHALVAGDVKEWPGYVACDGESGLETVAGIAIPVRRGERTALVWDLDSTQPLDPSDGPLFAALFARLPLVQPLARSLT